MTERDVETGIKNDTLWTVGLAHRAAVTAKSVNPGSPQEEEAMERLINVIAKDPTALDVLNRLEQK